MNNLKRSFDSFSHLETSWLSIKQQKMDGNFESVDELDQVELISDRFKELVNNKNQNKIIFNFDNDKKTRIQILEHLKIINKKIDLSKVTLIFNTTIPLPVGTTDRMQANDYLARYGNMSLSFLLQIPSLSEWQALISQVDESMDFYLNNLNELLINYHEIEPLAVEARFASLKEIEELLTLWKKSPESSSSPIFYDMLELRACVRFKSEYLKNLIQLESERSPEGRINPRQKFQNMIKRVIQLQKGESFYVPSDNISQKGGNGIQFKHQWLQPRSLEYHSIIEQIDPLHRTWGDKYNYPIFKKWCIEKEKNESIPHFLIWLESQELIPAKKTLFDNLQKNEKSGYHVMEPLAETSFQGVMHMAKYLRTKEERAPFQLTHQNGVFTDYQGSLIDTSAFKSLQEGIGWAIAVQFLDGTFYAGQHQHFNNQEHSIEVMHHSSFAAGGDLSWAGLLKVEMGKIVAISNQSGHYYTDTPNAHHKCYGNTLQMLRTLHAKGVDLSEIKLELIQVTQRPQMIRLRERMLCMNKDIEQFHFYNNAHEFLFSEGKCLPTSTKIKEEFKELVEQIRSNVEMMQKRGVDPAAIEVILDLPESFYSQEKQSIFLGPKSVTAKEFLENY